MIDWVFLDVGNVLLDEDPLTFLSFLRHAEAVRRVRPAVRFDDLLADRESRAAAGSAWPVFEAVSAYLDEPACTDVWESTAREIRARFVELSPPIPGAAALVARLASRFRLGLIANQGRECRAHLDALGLLEPFEVVVLGEERGIAKPDRRLFADALKRAGAAPGRCVMVGDRLDNDLAPASAVGMATCWVRWPDRAAKGWRPATPEALAYRDSLARVALRAPALWPDVHPSLTVDAIGDLGAADLADLCGNDLTFE